MITAIEPEYEEVKVVSSHPILNSQGDQIGVEILDEKHRLWYQYNPGIAHTMGSCVHGKLANGSILVPRGNVENGGWVLPPAVAQKEQIFICECCGRRLLSDVLKEEVAFRMRLARYRRNCPVCGNHGAGAGGEPLCPGCGRDDEGELAR